MAGTDVTSPTPVRTQTNGDVVAFLADGTTNTQLLGIDTSGRVTVKLDDGNGNLVTSQVNGTQRALDVGINVAGIQIDPRAIRALTSADVVSVVQSTSPWITSDLADGSATGGTAGTKSLLAGAIYNTTLPTLTNGQQASLQLDASGRLLVDIGTEVGTLATSDAADGPVTPGTVASKSILTGGQYNSTLPTLTTGQQAAIQVDSSGRLLVSQGTSPWLTKDSSDGSVTGGTAATTSMLGGGVFTSATGLSTALTAGQQAALQFDANGRLLVDLVTSIPAGANLIGSVNQGTSPWITSDLADGSLTGGTAGTKSLAAGGIFTSATGLSTTLTAGQQAAVQLDANGRIIVGSIVNSLPAGTNLLGGTNVYVGGTIASATNPLPVVISSTLPGSNVVYYNATSAIAVNGVDNTSVYTITTGKVLSLKKIWASSSVHMRVDFATSTNGSTYTTAFTGFTPFGGGACTFDTDLFSITDSGTGSTVRVTLTNLDRSGNTASGYVTILGIEN